MSEVKCLWRNEHGWFSLDGNRYGPGDTFTAYPSQVPAGFRDTISLVKEVEGGNAGMTRRHAEVSDSNLPKRTTVSAPAEPSPQRRTVINPPVEEEIEEEETDEVKTSSAPLFSVVAREAKGWYDVVSSLSGEVMNVRGLRIDAAAELAKELNDGSTGK
jgi:hypothetical protein